MTHAPENRRLPVLVAQPRARDERASWARSATGPLHGAYTAQLLGQDGARRGLRGGRPVLDQAHSAYLGSEWSGSADRRRPLGLLLGAAIWGRPAGAALAGPPASRSPHMHSLALKAFDVMLVALIFTTLG